LREAGVPASHIDCPPETAAQFDSETLWQHVRHQVRAQHSVLIVRGSDGTDESAAGQGRDWLGQQLQALGVQVQWLAAYVRCVPEWNEAQRQLAQAASHDGSVWLFSSSQALTHLVQRMPRWRWDQALALATHPRIAQAAQDLGFARVRQVRPVLADVVASLESLA
jgi:uroporphyrinogen-III synthase